MEQFLLMPYGMMYNEVTAASIVKVDRNGDVIDPGSTTLRINRDAFLLQAAVLMARPDILCTIHFTSPAAVSVNYNIVYFIFIFPFRSSKFISVKWDMLEIYL